MSVLRRIIRPEDCLSLEGRHFRGERIEFSRRTRYNLARECSFTDCEIVLDPKGMPAARFSHARVHFFRTRFEGCTITAVGGVRGLDLYSGVQVDRCRFVGGPYIEPHFGRNPYSEQDASRIVDSDFSQADLRDARFKDTLIEELKLPGWPHITVVARDGAEIYAMPNPAQPARSELHRQVVAFDWQNKEVGMAMWVLVAGVGIALGETGRGGFSVQIQHVDDIVGRHRVSPELLKSELDRFSHPAIRY
jgi:hypothetical protein